MIPRRSKACGEGRSFGFGVFLVLLTRDLLEATSWTQPYRNFRYFSSPATRHVNVDRNASFCVGSTGIIDDQSRIDPKLVRLSGKLGSFGPEIREMIERRRQKEAFRQSSRHSDNSFNGMAYKLERAGSFPCTSRHRFSKDRREKKHSWFRGGRDLDGILKNISPLNGPEGLLGNVRFSQKRSKMHDQDPSVDIAVDEIGSSTQKPPEYPQQTPAKPCGGRGFKMVYEGCETVREWVVLFNLVTRRDQLLQLLKKKHINAPASVTNTSFFKRAVTKLAKKLKSSNKKLQKLTKKGRRG